MPKVRSVYSIGDSQPLSIGSPSSEHSNSAPNSFVENVKSALISGVTAAGFACSVAMGAVTSGVIVQLYETGVEVLS